MNTATPFARPLYVMLKPIGSTCNLRCEYCYYLEKKGLYPEEKKHSLTDDLLEEFTRQYLQSQTMLDVMFTWHGGEALLRSIEFYEKALSLQRKYGDAVRIANSIQTNGTLLTDEWCRFFKENNFLVGISVDGPQHCHDIYRKTADGGSSFHQVMRGIERLKKHNVDYNIMAVVNSYNVDYPLDFYHFFKEMDARFIQFAPIVETQSSGELTGSSVSAEKWGDFLTAIFDEWVRNDVGQFFVQLFDSALASWIGEQPGTCIFAQTCGHAGVMEFNGDVYPCDHYVFPELKLGNINDKTLTEIMYSPEQQQFGMGKCNKLPSQCKQCEFLFACNGECPKNRISQTQTGEPGLNHLCNGYYKFFTHIAPYMDYMKAELLAHRPPANIMHVLKSEGRVG